MYLDPVEGSMLQVRTSKKLKPIKRKTKQNNENPNEPLKVED